MARRALTVCWRRGVRTLSLRRALAPTRLDAGLAASAAAGAQARPLPLLVREPPAVEVGYVVSRELGRRAGEPALVLLALPRSPSRLRDGACEVGKLTALPLLARHLVLHLALLDALHGRGVGGGERPHVGKTDPLHHGSRACVDRHRLGNDPVEPDVLAALTH